MTDFVTRFRTRPRSDRKATFLPDGRPAVELTHHELDRKAAVADPVGDSRGEENSAVGQLVAEHEVQTIQHVKLLEQRLLPSLESPSARPW